MAGCGSDGMASLHFYIDHDDQRLCSWLKQRRCSWRYIVHVLAKKLGERCLFPVDPYLDAPVIDLEGLRRSGGAADATSGAGGAALHPEPTSKPAVVVHNHKAADEEGQHHKEQERPEPPPR